MNKIKYYLFAVLLTCSSLEQNLYSINDDETTKVSSVNETLNDDTTPVEFYYIFDFYTDETVNMTDGSQYPIGWWYNNIPRKWSKGDRIAVAITDSGSNNWKLTNVDKGDIAWGVLGKFPTHLPHISKITPSSSETDKISKLALSSALVFKGKYSDSFDIKMKQYDWKVNQRIFILHDVNNDGYHLFNADAKDMEYNAHLVSAPKTISTDSSLERILLSLEGNLNEKVLQQPEATFAVTMALYNYVAGLKPKELPIGVFLFLGPTGVGKTELAKALNQELYGNPQNLVRFDMSQFSQEWNITRLIGSAPGYVNHEDGGQLTNALRSRPQSIVLLDEIEKAHDKVRKAFLPIFDEGIILDADNNPVDCSEVIFIMTSNLAGPEIAELHMMGYESDEILEIIEPKLIRELSPELYNRVVPVTFQPLMPESMPKLVELMLKGVKARLLSTKNIRMQLDQTALDYLVEKGYHPLLGARPLKRLIEKKITTLLSIAIVRKEVNAGELVVVHYSEEDNSFYLVVVEES